jgi:hypothetical protein
MNERELRLRRQICRLRIFSLALAHYQCRCERTTLWSSMAGLV